MSPVLLFAISPPNNWEQEFKPKLENSEKKEKKETSLSLLLYRFIPRMNATTINTGLNDKIRKKVLIRRLSQSEQSRFVLVARFYLHCL